MDDIKNAAELGVFPSLKAGILRAIERRRGLSRPVEIVMLHPIMIDLAARSAGMDSTTWALDMVNTIKAHVMAYSDMEEGSVHFIGPNGKDEGLIKFYNPSYSSPKH